MAALSLILVVNTEPSINTNYKLPLYTHMHKDVDKYWIISLDFNSDNNGIFGYSYVLGIKFFTGGNELLLVNY